MRNIIFLLFFTLSLSAQKVYKTPSGQKYHLGSCRMVENVSTEISLKEAAELGLQPCKICKPQNYTALGFVQSTNTAQGQKETSQCKGTTKKGTRCKHMTSIANGYCFQHNPDK